MSDHACCAEADKGEDLCKALPGFGGTALRANPARAFGLYPRKGAIAVGSDADLVVLDPNRERTVTSEVLGSAEDFTPFAGMRVRGWPIHTRLRGRTVFQDEAVQGSPQGQYVKRPVGLYGAATQGSDSQFEFESG